MTRLLGVDYGKKRVGLALSDPLGMIASGYETLEVRSKKQLLADLKSVIESQQVSKIVMGLPVRSTGEEGEMAEVVRAFGQKLEAATGLEVVYVDERFTSTIAQQALQAQGIKPSRKKHLVDKTAAALILQNYLDSQSLGS